MGWGAGKINGIKDLESILQTKVSMKFPFRINDLRDCLKVLYYENPSIGAGV
jgi:hypothetical protein